MGGSRPDIGTGSWGTQSSLSSACKTVAMTRNPATTLAQRERQALCDLFLQVGPDAPTLCEGWVTHDLLSHLIIREGRPDAAAGMVLPFLKGHLESTAKAVLQPSFEAAVSRLRAGPPRFSAFALPGADERANTTEYFIHHEDVRRAQSSWEPREFSAPDQTTLWDAARTMGRLVTMRRYDGVVLVVPDGPRAKVSSARGSGKVQVVTGDPGELLLWISGREDHARVDIT